MERTVSGFSPIDVSSEQRSPKVPREKNGMLINNCTGTFQIYRRILWQDGKRGGNDYSLVLSRLCHSDMHGLLFIADSSVEDREVEGGWKEVSSAMIRRDTLTQKSKLKKNRMYFSNFKPLMPMLGYSCPKKWGKRGSKLPGTREQKAQMFGV